MALETYRIWLQDGRFIHIVFLQEAGVVIAFAVVLVAETPDGMVNIARYDTAHGIAHRDVLGRRKGLLRKQWFPKVPLPMCSIWPSRISSSTMKAMSVTSMKTKRHRVPPLPASLRRAARDALTADEARRIVRAHGGRRLTDDEARQFAVASLASVPAG